MLSVEKPGSPEEIVEHFGIKGMKWGVRSTRRQSLVAGRKAGSAAAREAAKGGASNRQARKVGRKVASDTARETSRNLRSKKGEGRTKRAAKALGRAADTTAFVLGTQDRNVQGKIAGQATDKLIKSMPRIKARHGEYGKLSNRMKKPFSKEAKAYRDDVKKTYLRHLESTANSMTNTRGSLRYTLKENGQPNTSKYMWDISVEQVKHAAQGVFKVRPIFDDEGWIVDIELVDDEMEQTMDRGIDFLAHMGMEV
jgi:hypothetical protein